MEGLLRDVRCAVRALSRARVLTLTAVTTLAVGIGLSTGVLAVAYGVLLKPLPYAEPSQLVAIESRWAIDPGGDIGTSLDGVDEWRQRTRAFTTIAGHSDAEFTIRGDGEPFTARVAMVTDGFFDVLGLPPSRGTAAAIAGAGQSVALSQELASRHAAATSLTVGTERFEVVAVMPPDYRFPSSEIGVWVSARAVPAVAFFSTDDQRRFRLIARLQPGVSLAQAQDDATRVQGELNGGLAEGRRRAVTVRPLEDQVRGDARASVLPYVAGAGVVLLIACANVSGLLVGRSAARRREFAVRRALGGHTGHLLRAALTETMAITFCGWLLGLWFAHLVIRAFAAFGERAIPNLAGVRLDTTMILVSLVLALVVAVMTAIAPAIRALRAEAGSALREASDRSGRAFTFGRRGLVVAQIALTVVLLVAAGLLLRTVLKIIDAERGFELRNAVAMRLMLTETVRFRVAHKIPIVAQLVSELQALSGVLAAGIGSDIPPRDTQIQMTVRVVVDDQRQPDVFPLSFAAVTPGYLEAIGATLVKGRFLEERDRQADPPAVVISESAARRVAPNGKDPLGTDWPVGLPAPGGKRVRPRVVGIIRDVKYGGLERADAAGVFTTWERLAPSQSYLVVRTSGEVSEMMAAIRAVVRRVDPTLPLYPIQSLEEVVAGSMADRRLRLQLATVFAALSLGLAAIALWGAVAQNVQERRRELAIRMSLGATQNGAVGLIVRGGALLIGIGVASGVLVAGLSMRGLQHLLHGVAPLDPLTFALGAVVAGLVSLLACYVPARGAAAISPAELLREG
jgi:putative ABC transport system permease protein